MWTFLPNFEKRGGLVVVVVQDSRTHQVLMVAYADESAYRETLETGEAVFFSTSRKERWKKGETSGHILTVVDILIDCDGDALVYLVEPHGPACHTNATSCFFRTCIDVRLIVPEPEKFGWKEAISVCDVPVCERLSQSSAALRSQYASTFYPQSH